MGTPQTSSPMRWPQRVLKDVTHQIFVGLPTSRHLATGAGDAIRERVLSVGDLSDGQIITLSDAPLFSLRKDDYDRFRVRDGDVLVSCRGTVPKVAQVTRESEGTLASSSLIVIRAATELLPEVVAATLRSPVVLGLLWSRTRSAAGQMQLTAKDIAALVVPVPPQDVQRRIASVVDARERAYRLALRAASARRGLCDEAIVRVLLGETTESP